MSNLLFQGEDEPYAPEDCGQTEGGPEYHGYAHHLQRAGHVQHNAGTEVTSFVCFWSRSRGIKLREKQSYIFLKSETKQYKTRVRCYVPTVYWTHLMDSFLDKGVQNLKVNSKIKRCHSLQPMIYVYRLTRNHSKPLKLLSKWWDHEQ